MNCTLSIYKIILFEKKQIVGTLYIVETDRRGAYLSCLQLVPLHDDWRGLWIRDAKETEQPGILYFKRNRKRRLKTIENPVGRMGKLSGLDSPYYFNPCDFAGYLNPSPTELLILDGIRKKNGKGVTQQQNDFVLQKNAYNKKTGLWGCFNREMVKKRIEPVKTAPQGTFTQRLGGKSERTKELRSETPAGFAQAFFEANNHW